ncbi:hypothetical protein HDV01_007478 [Terramyces sp. JEL0728]|nr:hypothetical protein HDV01_007478 [Terramyces sp. JEL0728]
MPILTIATSCAKMAKAIYDLSREVEYNREMCSTMAIKASAFERILEKITVESQAEALQYELELLETNLTKVQAFVEESKGFNILERIFKKNSYRRRCNKLMTEMDSNSVALQIAFQTNINNKVESIYLNMDEPRAVLEKTRQTVEYAAVKDYQTSVSFLRNNPVTNDMGQVTRKVAEAVKTESSVQAQQNILEEISEETETGGPTLGRSETDIDEQFKVATREDYDNAEKLFKAGDLSKALDAFSALSAEYPEAHFRVGQIYQQPSAFLQAHAKKCGIEVNNKKAALHYYLAHRQGCDRGLPFLGNILYEGSRGNGKEIASAKEIFTLGMKSQDKGTSVYCQQSMAQLG